MHKVWCHEHENILSASFIVSSKKNWALVYMQILYKVKFEKSIDNRRIKSDQNEISLYHHYYWTKGRNQKGLLCHFIENVVGKYFLLTEAVVGESSKLRYFVGLGSVLGLELVFLFNGKFIENYVDSHLRLRHLIGS